MICIDPLYAHIIVGDAGVTGTVSADKNDMGISFIGGATNAPEHRSVLWNGDRICIDPSSFSNAVEREANAQEHRSALWNDNGIDPSSVSKGDANIEGSLNMNSGGSFRLSADGCIGEREISRSPVFVKAGSTADDKASIINWKNSCVRVQTETMMTMILMWRAGVCWEICVFLEALVEAVLNSQSEWVSTTDCAWAGRVVPAGSEFGRCA